MTGTDVITNRARFLLDDTDVTALRWDDSQLIRYCNDGTRMIITDRPEALLSSGQVSAALAEIAVIGGTISIPDRYRDALAHYIASQALAEEAQDKRDLARSSAMFNRFVTKANLSQTMRRSNGK